MLWSRSISAPRATARPRYVFTLSVSPGRCRARSVLAIVRLSAKIFHFVSDWLVSAAAVSLSAMSILASASRAPFTSIVSLSRSIPFDDSQSSSSSPLILRSPMNPLVLIFAWCKDSSSMTTRFFSNGSSLTSAISSFTSAMVSVT